MENIHKIIHMEYLIILVIVLVVITKFFKIKRAPNLRDI